NLLDFSLQYDLFFEHVLEMPECRRYLFEGYRHLIADNVEEDTPRAHDLLQEWLERCATALVVMDQGPLQLVSAPDLAVPLVAGPIVDDREDFDQSDRWPPERFPLLATIGALHKGPAGHMFADLRSGWEPSANWMRLRWPILGYSHPEVETMPDLEMLDMPVARGIQVPLSREFDREFLYSRGASPPVLEIADSRPLRLTVPLTSETTSWDRLQAELRNGRLPPPEQIHPEHFLAALDYGLPAPESRELALRTAAGPSVFNTASAGLLQVSVKAQVPTPASRRPTHLTIALDLSASMDWDQRLPAAREGILRSLSGLHPADCFSLIVFREEPHLLIREAKIADLPLVYEAIDRLKPGGGANLSEVLPWAIAATLETTKSESDVQRRLVLITDSPVDLVPEVATGLGRVLQATRKDSFSFDVLDLGDRRDGETGMEELAEAGGGTLRRVHTAPEVRWALFEILQGAPSLIARDAELEVEFNPEAVAAYRLVGHECRTSGGLAPGPVQADLHAGEEVTALFEVWLHPNDVDDVAVAKLRWRDAQTGTSERTDRIRISRLQFSTSFEGMPLSLQEAAIAAEAAEVLRQSFNFDVTAHTGYRYEPKPRDLQHVIDAADRVNPRVKQRADFQRMIASIARAERISAQRPPAVAKSGARGIIAGRWRESRE
ncbi:MAG: DUF3520 domain-containing protein, partial [Planctomycetes bacterium]|nr:DUF3520 domain-containing protein [Planctomycetota bacterium]